MSLERAAAGELRLLYVAPERFSSPGFVQRMREARVGLFVVDEAHCVSQWGHDFRPDYFRLADAARHLGAAAIIASTATATPRVAVDIARRLGLRDPVKVATGFDRPNLSFAVARPAPHEKRPLIARALGAADALPAIVYASTRAGSEEIATTLTAELGEEALAYHAGLDRGTRAAVQRRFLADEARVIVATNAFGMGVDKPNVRTVVHAGTPSSLEAYYQEAGRGGRDGRPARALLLAENRDKALHVHFIKREEVDAELPAALADRVQAVADGDGRYSVDAAELARTLGGGWDRLRALLGHLARAGVIVPSPAAPDRVVGRMGERGFDRRAAAACRAICRGGRPRPLAAIPRDLGLRGGRGLSPEGDPEAFRRRRRARPSVRSRPLLRCLRRRLGAGAAGAGCGRHRRAGRRDPVSRARRSPRRWAYHVRRDPARCADEEDRAQLL